MVLCGAIAALAVIIVGIILLAKGCSGGTDALAGTWEFDGTTTYSFDGSGSGAKLSCCLFGCKCTAIIENRWRKIIQMGV